MRQPSKPSAVSARPQKRLTIPRPDAIFRAKPTGHKPLIPAAEFFAVMAFPNIDPVAFSIGPVAVHWYGLAYVAGILLGLVVCPPAGARAPTLWPGNTPPMTIAQLDDFLVWAALGIVLGGRIGYILFYDFAAVREQSAARRSRSGTAACRSTAASPEPPSP